jgi:hypothetical protein
MGDLGGKCKVFASYPNSIDSSPSFFLNHKFARAHQSLSLSGEVWSVAQSIEPEWIEAQRLIYPISPRHLLRENAQSRTISCASAGVSQRLSYQCSINA